MTKLRNIFELPQTLNEDEVFEVLAHGDVKIERIVSTGQPSPENEWYDQLVDEWVILLQGEATINFEDVGEVKLIKGDYILIKAHERHKVTKTSAQPPCIWLAVHGNLSLK